MWTSKEDEPNDLSSERCYARARALLRWLHARTERHIAVVSHSVFLSHLLRLFPELCLSPDDVHFENAELREFVLTVDEAAK